MIVAPSANAFYTAAVAALVALLLSGWVIQLVSLAVGQSRSPTDFPGTQFFDTSRAAGQLYALDWWYFSFFTLINLFLAYALIMDRKDGSIVKYRIVASVWSGMAAVFCTLRINTLVFPQGPFGYNSVLNSLLAGYIILAIGYYAVPWFFGTSFLATVAQSGSGGGNSPRESTHPMVSGQTEQGQGYQAQPGGGYQSQGYQVPKDAPPLSGTTGAALDVPLHSSNV